MRLLRFFLKLISSMHRREADTKSGWVLNNYRDWMIRQTEAKVNIHSKRVSPTVTKLTCHCSYLHTVRVNTLTISKTTINTTII